MKKIQIPYQLKQWSALLRWNKPSGRLILLIPAGWALWLTPSAPPETELLSLIILGGLAISAAGCIANDLWDKNIDKEVNRTAERPLAKGSVKNSTAFFLLLFFLSLSLFVVLSLPMHSRGLCLRLAILALPPILLYPSAKRWFPYPQAILAICWGFSVLIPWGASEANLNGGTPLLGCWLATLFWTFGFDTVYAIADKDDDQKLGLKSSVLSLGENIKWIVPITYAIACASLANAAYFAGIRFIFWPIWIIATAGMQREAYLINNNKLKKGGHGKHFKNQVKLGSLLFLGLILGQIR
ncbi:4-hydroxybenzoate polyprenyltransferase [Prochlorococcus sp. MIT 1341]|uniref:4-hydroxybenzoate polyprenyltransferase n=1 Tax=Prochlorococcus sp. MIT 1341 TaxID=3096221 RepID=UPI002A75B487|nr:4-hydroxybenzoate polyprenyltransferase [Prochlorococcus sp. MIT 1341]